MRQAGTAVAALALILGAAPNLFAQDARVEVKVVVPGDVIRQLHRIVETTVGPQVRAEITQVMREAVVELSSMGLDLAEIGREISREVSREVQRGRTERDQDRRIEQVDTQTTKIALGPTGSFDLKNLSGEIIVTAGNGREVVMEITKRSRARTEAEAKLGLEQVKVEVDHRGDRATVETRYPDQQGRERTPYSVSVYYNITAPAGTRMNLTSISGDVTVKGMRGDLAVDVVSGDIQISNATRLTNIKSISGETTLTDIESATDLNIGAMSGDLTLLRVKVRRLSVNVISGDVSGTDISAESVELMSMSGSVEYAGPIAAKGRYQLQAHSGDVRFVIGGNVGFDLRAETYSGRIRSDASIEIKGATSSARSLRGTVGDGSAVVVATTFSGNVFLSRR